MGTTRIGVADVWGAVEREGELGRQDGGLLFRVFILLQVNAAKSLHLWALCLPGRVGRPMAALNPCLACQGFGCGAKDEACESAYKQ